MDEGEGVLGEGWVRRIGVADCRSGVANRAELRLRQTGREGPGNAKFRPLLVK